MNIRTVSNLFLLGILCATLNATRQTRPVPMVCPTLPPASAVVTPEQFFEGTYTRNCAFQVTLELYSEHCFAYIAHHCTGDSLVAKGTWEYKNGLLILHPEKPVSWMSELALRFQPTRWNNKLFMVAEKEKFDFVYALSKPTQASNLSFFYSKNSIVNFTQNPSGVRLWQPKGIQ